MFTPRSSKGLDWKAISRLANVDSESLVDRAHMAERIRLLSGSAFVSSNL